MAAQTNLQLQVTKVTDSVQQHHENFFQNFLAPEYFLFYLYS